MNTPKKILVIDGDQNLENILTETLGAYPYSVLHANNGTEGIQKVFEFNPDFIFYHSNNGHLDECAVFKALQASSLSGGIPVSYLIDNALNGRLDHEMSINEHDLITKAGNRSDLARSIQCFLYNYEKAGGDAWNDFDRLFHLSPHGILLCNEEDVVSANDYLLNLLKSNSREAVKLKLEDLFDITSFLKIKHWLAHYEKDQNSSFNDRVIFISAAGEKFDMNLNLSEFKNSANGRQFIGFLLEASPVKNSMVNYQLANEVCNLLKRENVAITDVVEKKITQIVKLRTVDSENQHCSFFTKRENEVLRLSMEGLSIKVIADKLSISTRTVEKYRTKMMEKSGGRNIVEVIVFSLKNNLIRI